MKKSGSGTTCAVVSCKHSRKHLNEWLDRECYDHKPATKRQCPCAPMFKFFRKPDTDSESMAWLKALNLNKPPRNVFVCSFHFVDQKPTKDNPFPELWLGYNRSPQPKRRQPIQRTTASPQIKKRRLKSEGFPSALGDVESVDSTPTVNLGYQTTKPEAALQREQRMKLKEDQHRRAACAMAMLDLQQTTESPGMSPDLMQIDEQPANNPQSEGISGNGTLNDQGYADAGCQTELTMDDIEKMEDVLRQNTTERGDLWTKALDTQFNQESFEKNEDKKKFYIGIPTSPVALCPCCLNLNRWL